MREIVKKFFHQSKYHSWYYHKRLQGTIVQRYGTNQLYIDAIKNNTVLNKDAIRHWNKKIYSKPDWSFLKNKKFSFIKS